MKGGRMLRPDPESRTVEAQTLVPLTVPMPSDLDLARSIATAIREVEGVVDMGSGRFAQAATYGPGERVMGVILRHPTPAALAVEAHVVLDERMLVQALSAVSPSDVSSSSEDTPIVVRVADHIRAVVFQTVHQFGVLELTTVDVAVDDLG